MPINLTQLLVHLAGADAEGSPPTENPILVAGQDGTNVQSLKTNATGQLEVAVVSGGGSGGLTDAELRAAPVPMSIDQTGNNNAVDVLTSALPTGAATAANQATANASLVAIDAGTPAALGQTTMAASQPVVLASDQSAVPVSGTVSVSEPVSVDDNGASLTVDNPVISVVGGGTEAAAQRVTIANDSTGVLSVDDNGGSLTVDGTVTANAGTNLNTSALALESGGNLAAAAASLATLDNIVSGSEAQVDVVAALPAGTNNIGDVDVLTLPSIPAGTNNIGDVDVLTLPALAAGTNNIGIVRTIPTSGRIVDSDDGTTVITVKTAAGLATASGDNTVIAAVPGKKLRVMSYGLQVQSTDALVACIWQDTSTATQRGMRWMLTGTADGTSMQGVVRNPGDGAHYYFETAAGAGLDLNLSATADVAWEVTYAEVD